jgi:hypothetical protein
MFAVCPLSCGAACQGEALTRELIFSRSLTARVHFSQPLARTVIKVLYGQDSLVKRASPAPPVPIVRLPSVHSSVRLAPTVQPVRLHRPSVCPAVIVKPHCRKSNVPRVVGVQRAPVFAPLAVRAATVCSATRFLRPPPAPSVRLDLIVRPRVSVLTVLPAVGARPLD